MTDKKENDELTQAVDAYQKAVNKLTGYGENNLSWMQVIHEALRRTKELESSTEALKTIIAAYREIESKLLARISEAEKTLTTEKHFWSLLNEKYTASKLEIEALKKAQEWKDIDEWHEDLDPCIFIFFKNEEFYDLAWFCPNTETHDGKTFHDLYGDCQKIYFMPLDIKTENFPDDPCVLPDAPESEA